VVLAFYPADWNPSAAIRWGFTTSFWMSSVFENQRAPEDEDLVAYAGELGLDETRLIREVTSSGYPLRIREDFKSDVRGGVNETPTLFINGERYDGARDLKQLLEPLTTK